MIWFRRKKDEEEPTPAGPRALEEVRQTREELAREAPRGFFERLRKGIGKTRANLVDQMRQLFAQAPRVDDALFEELEALLISADCGVESALEIVETVRERFAADPSMEPRQALAIVKDNLLRRVSRNHAPMNLDRPFSVILVVGVNGVGKTTTIAKLANIFKAYGKKIMLVAGDTFRAGAIEQLVTWGARLGIDVRRGSAGADPSSVVFDALSGAQAGGTDLVLVDTAGRLHTQRNLMEELKKVRRVIQKVCPDGPHETFLVLDATTGQNGLNQARVFHEALDLTGLVLTKLDGTAKGGIVIAVTEKLGLPIRFVGVGEAVDDLDAFRSEDYIEALFADSRT